METTSTITEPIVPPAAKLHRDRIIVGERMRIELGSEDDLNDLAESIKERGLIHPPAVDEKGNLVAGGRRFHVLTKILNWDWIPVTLAETGGSMAKLRMLELEENFHRKEMTWKENVNTVAEVHRLHWKESALKSEKWTTTMTGRLLGNISAGKVDYCLKFAEYLRNPNHPVQKANSLNEAIQIMLEIKETEFIKENSKLAQELQQSKGSPEAGASLSIDSLIQGLKKTETGDVHEGTTAEMDAQLNALLNEPDKPAAAPAVVAPGAQPPKEKITVQMSKYFDHGDSLKTMEAMPQESMDTILTDIPYAIEMSNLEQSNEQLIDVADVATEHDVEKNILLFREFFPRAYRVLKPNAYMVVWYDLDHHKLFQELATASGFQFCRWPLHWVKTHRCKNQAAQYNFTKAVEHAMVFRKGNPTLVSPQGTNYWVGDNADAVKEFGHPFAKPEGLWKWCANAVAQKGSTIYDPFMGSGSGPIAFSKAGYYPRGTEKVEKHFNKAINKFQELMVQWFPNKEVIFQ